MNEITQNEFNDKASIKVVGAGGTDGNAVNHMIAERLQNVEFVAVNTDARDLLCSDADTKTFLSDKSSYGLGVDVDPKREAKAAQDHRSNIEEMLKGVDMMFVICDEGGGTGAGASPIVARATHQQDALTTAVVAHPFGFEGPQRSASAEYDIDNLRKEVNALIVIPNNRLFELPDRFVGTVEASKAADAALLAGVQGTTDLILMNSYTHVGFNDVNSILRGADIALFDIGSARGEDRATQAAEITVSSPLLEESIGGAHNALINIAGPTDLKLQEASAATELAHKAIHPEAQIIWSLALNDTYGDEVHITVIVAGSGPVAARGDGTQSMVMPVVPTTADPAIPAAQPAPAPALAAQSAATAQSASTPATGGSASLPFDGPTSAYPNIAVNDPVGNPDIPGFLRRED